MNGTIIGAEDQMTASEGMEGKERMHDLHGIRDMHNKCIINA